MKIRILLIVTSLVLLSSLVFADMNEIELISKEVGLGAQIVTIPNTRCPHSYLVKKEDASIWFFTVTSTVKGYKVSKVLAFQGDD